MGRWKACLTLKDVITRSPSVSHLSPMPLKVPQILPASRKGIQRLGFRFLSSAIPSPSNFYDNEFIGGNLDFGQKKYTLEPKEEEEVGNIPVKAYFLSTRKHRASAFQSWLANSTLQQ